MKSAENSMSRGGGSKGGVRGVGDILKADVVLAAAKTGGGWWLQLMGQTQTPPPPFTHPLLHRRPPTSFASKAKGLWFLLLLLLPPVVVVVAVHVACVPNVISCLSAGGGGRVWEDGAHGRVAWYVAWLYILAPTCGLRAVCVTCKCQKNIMWHDKYCTLGDFCCCCCQHHCRNNMTDSFMATWLDNDVADDDDSDDDDDCGCFSSFCCCCCYCYCGFA